MQALHLVELRQLSGTAGAFAVMLCGNSYSGINFRAPLCLASHDPSCKANCLGGAITHRLQRMMARAARRATQYFTGYLQKSQPLGRKEVQKAFKQLVFLETKTEHWSPAGKRLAAARRLFGDMEQRCCQQTLTEEAMLAAHWDGSETTSADCVRSLQFRNSSLQRQRLANRVRSSGQ